LQLDKLKQANRVSNYIIDSNSASRLTNVSGIGENILICDINNVIRIVGCVNTCRFPLSVLCQN